jgi:hypothetical protein
MERAQKKFKKATVAMSNRFKAFEHKPKAVCLPFGLEGKVSPLLNDILSKDDSLSSSVTGLMAQAKAKGTMEGYGRTTARFAEFCRLNGYAYPAFTEQAALHFVIQLDKDKTTLAVLGQVSPALSLVEKLSGCQATAMTATVATFLSAAKRRAAVDKPIVKKAGILPDNTLHRLLPVCFTPHAEGLLQADPVLLRTFVRATVVYFTFCRFNCYSKLRAMDLEDNGYSILVTFPAAKNDQYHNGQATCLVPNDKGVNPVEILRTYFQLCGFQFGRDNRDKSLLNCVMRKKKNGWVADGRRGVCYGTATKNLQTALAKVGIVCAKATDKSIKGLGVTRTIEAGISPDEVREQGRWKTITMPLHYKTNSTSYKEQIASNVPV